MIRLLAGTKVSRLIRDDKKESLEFTFLNEHCRETTVHYFSYPRYKL